MSEGENIQGMLESIRTEIRAAEIDIGALKERLTTLLRMEAMLEAQLPRRPGRPRKGDIIEMPTRVAGGAHSDPQDIVA